MEAPKNERLFEPDASIVLVGCRGAGKRSLGFMGALHLRWRLVTEDHYFEKATGLSRGKYLARYGKAAFARRNIEVFKDMLETNQTRCIIECGMTSLTEEAQVALRAYCASHPVVYVHREREQMLLLLDDVDAGPLLLADKTHRTCSNMEYFNLYDTSSPRAAALSGTATPEAQQYFPSKLLCARDDFANFLDLVTGKGVSRAWLESPFSLRAIPPEYRAHSYALRVRLSYILQMDLEWEDFEALGDCVELIIDVWPEGLLDLVAMQVAQVRRKLGVPIIFHVEENPRGKRRTPPEERDRVDLEVLELGLRLGVDYLSLDLQRKESFVTHILKLKGRSKIIGNYWYFGMGALRWADERQLENYRRAQLLGCDIIRMVRFYSGDSPAEKLEEFRARIRDAVPDPKPPLVAFDFSVLGVRTPMQSTILNPVKHPHTENEWDYLATLYTYPSAFGLLFRNFELDPLHFFVVGANVSYSLSPAMHHAAYDFSSMPHTYQSYTCTTVEELTSICTRDNFGGASLAAPFKVAMMPHLKLKSHHAAVIGAVNVLLPLRGSTNLVLDHANSRNRAGPVREFYGDNTDWSSIHTCLRRAISPRNYVQPSRTTGLVVGAGGMARAAIYALFRLGCRNIFIYNRSVASAEAVARHFNEWAAAQGPSAGMALPDGNLTAPSQLCHVLTSTSQPWPSDFQQPTMVISCVPATSTDGTPPADFVMPLHWLKSPTGGVVVELAYEPLVTPLVAQMRTLHGNASPPWVVVDGLEVVSEMAIEAFELMTGRMAPKRLMTDVCRRTWEQQQRDGSTLTATSSIRTSTGR
ncbi:hypothetical protein VTK73DRAFT_3430 [Phialemonium thermophilum]|uniref:Quinate repressor protein n=1 Tax=Phialemonium thermophilum TaxID=223376 RepID=A0ABR3X053_9PEZI